MIHRGFCSNKSVCRTLENRLAQRSYHELSYAEHGDPAQVLHYLSDVTSPPRKLPSTAVQLEIHHAPWNPADMNAVQGTYPSIYPPGQERPCPSYIDLNRTVAGSEGYGRIVEVRGEPTNVQLGDWVTFGRTGLGTLRSNLWLDADLVLPIQAGPQIFQQDNAASVASIFQLGGTALGMLQSFVDLKPGDIIVQNAGNSGVGYVLSQLAKMLVGDELQVVSFVRRDNRSPENFDALVKHLKDTAWNDVVLAQEDYIGNRSAAKELISEWKGVKPKLALNAVGGSSSNLLLSLLAPGGTHVTYGGMSMRPVTVSAAQLIFKDVHVRGYWQSRWMMQHNYSEKLALINQIADAYVDGKLTPPPCEVFPLSNVAEALDFESRQSGEMIRKKVVFDCQENS